MKASIGKRILGILISSILIAAVSILMTILTIQHIFSEDTIRSVVKVINIREMIFQNDESKYEEAVSRAGIYGITKEQFDGVIDSETTLLMAGQVAYDVSDALIQGKNIDAVATKSIKNSFQENKEDLALSMGIEPNSEEMAKFEEVVNEKISEIVKSIKNSTVVKSYLNSKYTVYMPMAFGNDIIYFLVAIIVLCVILLILIFFSSYSYGLWIGMNGLILGTCFGFICYSFGIVYRRIPQDYVPYLDILKKPLLDIYQKAALISGLIFIGGVLIHILVRKFLMPKFDESMEIDYDEEYSEDGEFDESEEIDQDTNDYLEYTNDYSEEEQNEYKDDYSDDFEDDYMDENSEEYQDDYSDNFDNESITEYQNENTDESITEYQDENTDESINEYQDENTNKLINEYTDEYTNEFGKVSSNEYKAKYSHDYYDENYNKFNDDFTSNQKMDDGYKSDYMRKAEVDHNTASFSENNDPLNNDSVYKNSEHMNHLNNKEKDHTGDK